MSNSLLVQKIQRLLSLCCLLLSLLGGTIVSFSVAAAPAQTPPVTEGLAKEVPSTNGGAKLNFFNHYILTMRGTLYGYSPEERVEVASRRIRAALDKPGIHTATIKPIENNFAVELNGKLVFVVTHQDANILTEETPELLAKASAERLQQAVLAYESQSGEDVLLLGVIKVFIATIVLILLLRLLLKFNVHAKKVAMAWLNRELDRVHLALGKSGFLLLQGRWPSTSFNLATKVFLVLAALVLIHAWLLFCFDSFPYTRPWKEEILGFMARISAVFFDAILEAIPGLITAILIFWLVSILVRISHALFRPVESGEVDLGWLDRDTAPTTRRLATLALWLFGIVMAYPYLPGAQTEAFKGMSVLVGLMISIGASGVVGQVVSGFILIYAKAFRAGDYVRISENEGVVGQIGMFATRIRTVSGIEISLPNASVLGNAIKNYSRSDIGSGTVIETSVTIGYDTPWRQVHAMLLEAAAKVPEILTTPKPIVMQTALSDFYVKYHLAGALDVADTKARPQVLSDLHASIQDTFNQYGVQIMSPHYRDDPETEKIVAPERWATPPAKADS